MFFSFSDDVLLNIVVGGMIYALGSGTILKYGGSTGGLDILSQICSNTIVFINKFLKKSFFVNCLSKRRAQNGKRCLFCQG